MTDQPDDARKRHPRGVFPPFFAPRNGTARTDGPPAAPSGSWRRVSRLFTPPEGSRARRTPAVQQTPYTPPVTPAEATPLEPLPPVEAPAASAPPTPAEPGAQWLEAAPPAPEVESWAEVEEPASEVDGNDHPLEARADVEEPASVSGSDEFTVESLETEPIALAPSDAERLDVAVEAMDAMLPPREPEWRGESLASDATYDDMYVSAGYGYDDPSIHLGEADAIVEHEAEAVAEYEPEALAAHESEATAAYDPEPAAAYESEHTPESSPSLEADDGLPAAVDPWAGAELPEPAFGSIGWPSAEVAPAPPAPRGDDAEEMGAALAWSDADAEGSATTDSASAAGSAAGDVAADVAGDDALSDVAHELRDSSLAWRPEASAAADDYDDITARARFYGGGESGLAQSEIDEVEEVGHDAPEHHASAHFADDAELAAEENAGAAIADALARVAARIRAGEVELPSESAGVSDESALAAALAALLRGPRR